MRHGLSQDLLPKIRDIVGRVYRNAFPTRPQPSRETRNDPRFASYDIGEYTYGTPTVYKWIPGIHTLRIGRCCSIASEVAIFLDGEHMVEYASMFPFNQFPPWTDRVPEICFTKGDVVLGSDVWIGFRSTILSGVRIGHGAVIAAGSIVTKDVEPYTISGGVPARPIRRRCSDETVDRMLNIRWWDWPLDRIVAARLELNSSDLEEFAQRHATQSPPLSPHQTAEPQPPDLAD